MQIPLTVQSTPEEAPPIQAPTMPKNHTHRTVLVTPDQAVAWLHPDVNRCNRPITPGRVKQYAAAMKRGEWVANGQTLIFASTGRLLNGQHRLMGVVESNMAVFMDIIEGVDEAAFSTLDTGANRSSSDYLALAGEQHTKVLGTALTWLFRYINYKVVTTERPSNAQMRVVLNDNPNIRESAAYVNNKGFQKKETTTITDLLPPGLAAFVRYKIYEAQPVKAEEFFDKLVTGANLTNTDPVWWLRERLAKFRSEKTKKDQTEILALVIKAWNHYVVGNEIQQLRFHKNSEFPRFWPENA